MNENEKTTMARAAATLGAIQAYMPQRGENSIWDNAEDVIGELVELVTRLVSRLDAIREWRATGGAVASLGPVPIDAFAKDNWVLDEILQSIEEARP